MKSGGMMKNDNRNDRRTSGPAKGTEKTKATGKANAAGKTKVPAGKENRDGKLSSKRFFSRLKFGNKNNFF